MAFECRKAVFRRLHDPAFFQRYFVGRGLDVGAGEDGLAKYAYMFPRIESVREWQHSDGDGQLLDGIAAETFDFVHSSHSLEHMENPPAALARWLGVTRPGGHVIVTVPDFEMYEHNTWPSQNAEHTHAFTMDGRLHSADALPQWPMIVVIPELVEALPAALIKIERLEATFDWNENPNVDQTCFASGAAEACIEFILRKL